MPKIETGGINQYTHGPSAHSNTYSNRREQQYSTAPNQYHNQFVKQQAPTDLAATTKRKTNIFSKVLDRISSRFYGNLDDYRAKANELAQSIEDLNELFNFLRSARRGDNLPNILKHPIQKFVQNLHQQYTNTLGPERTNPVQVAQTMPIGGPMNSLQPQQGYPAATQPKQQPVVLTWRATAPDEVVTFVFSPHFSNPQHCYNELARPQGSSPSFTAESAFHHPGIAVHTRISKPPVQTPNQERAYHLRSAVQPSVSHGVERPVGISRQNDNVLKVDQITPIPIVEAIANPTPMNSASPSSQHSHHATTRPQILRTTTPDAHEPSPAAKAAEIGQIAAKRAVAASVCAGDDGYGKSRNVNNLASMLGQQFTCKAADFNMPRSQDSYATILSKKPNAEVQANKFAREETAAALGLNRLSSFFLSRYVMGDESDTASEKVCARGNQLLTSVLAIKKNAGERSEEKAGLQQKLKMHQSAVSDINAEIDDEVLTDFMEIDRQVKVMRREAKKLNVEITKLRDHLDQPLISVEDTQDLQKALDAVVGTKSALDEEIRVKTDMKLQFTKDLLRLEQTLKPFGRT